MCSLEMFFLATCVYWQGNIQVHFATQQKSLHKFNLRLLAATHYSVQSGFYTSPGGGGGVGSRE